MNNTTRLVIAAAVCMALGACTKKVKEVPAADTTGATSGATTGSIPDTTPGKFSPADLDTNACLRQRVI